MQSKTTYFYPHKTLRLGDRLLDLSTPKVMGILNITPDSFFDGGKYLTADDALFRAEKMINEGTDILDVGGMSSRPGAEIISEEEELKRIIPVIKTITSKFDIPVSIDTIRGKVAYEAIQHGAVLVNDISAGKFDNTIINVCAKNKIPYALMHMQGAPQNMQQTPVYNNVTEEVFQFMLDNCRNLTAKGIHEIIIDPGFGFGKTVEHNYELVKNLEIFQQIGFPILAGISRKSMICKVLKVNPEKALNGTTALHAILLLKGANILRVHDVKEAIEVIQIVQNLNIHLP
ncbi:MAG: dihydropteroate synthase [Fimbriimonadaceae bacterium]|nr:dihydropteroate synthase [Chitinophagales bacterium]